jgi:hypothetical protein
MTNTSTRERDTFTVDVRALLSKVPWFVVELAVFFAFFGLYFLGRGFVTDRPDVATENAWRIIDTQRALGFFWEPAWHEAALNSDRFIDIANFTYTQLHLPLVLVAGAVFFFIDMRKYRVLRNSLLLSGFMAMPFYWFFPVTPPRLLHLHGEDLGFVDTVGGMRGSKAEILTNDYAAVPSYHFGWILIVVIGVWWFWRSPVARGLAVAFIAWMTVCIVVTANHYFLDMALGGLMVTLAFLLARRWERYLGDHPAAERRFFTRGDYRQPF